MKVFRVVPLCLYSFMGFRGVYYWLKATPGEMSYLFCIATLVCIGLVAHEVGELLKGGAR